MRPSNYRQLTLQGHPSRTAIQDNFPVLDLQISTLWYATDKLQRLQKSLNPLTLFLDDIQCGMRYLNVSEFILLPSVGMYIQRSIEWR